MLSTSFISVWLLDNKQIFSYRQKPIFVTSWISHLRSHSLSTVDLQDLLTCFIVKIPVIFRDSAFFTVIGSRCKN